MVVIARTEALIAGLGQDEAIARGLAYEEAGADAILIHSKSKTPGEIMAFAKGMARKGAARGRAHRLSAAHRGDIAALETVAIVIYGNHAIRAAIGAMRDVFARIRRDGGIREVDKLLPSVAEVIRLQGDEAMRGIEAKFLR
jgi:phosphoenolpyruvate phosphomutase/phosphonopyruvate hydrolase